MIKLSKGSVAPKKDPEELFTIAEIDKMVAAAKTLRDKAIIATLAESGCRAGELLSCKIKNVIFTSNGCKLTMTGKTGKQTVDLVFAAPFIDHYLRSEHKLRDNPEASLWVTNYRDTPTTLCYSALDVLVKKSVVPPVLKSEFICTTSDIVPQLSLQVFGPNRS